MNLTGPSPTSNRPRATGNRRWTTCRTWLESDRKGNQQRAKVTSTVTATFTSRNNLGIASKRVRERVQLAKMAPTKTLDKCADRRRIGVMHSWGEAWAVPSALLFTELTMRLEYSKQHWDHFTSLSGLTINPSCATCDQTSSINVLECSWNFWKSYELHFSWLTLAQLQQPQQQKCMGT